MSGVVEGILVDLGEPEPEAGDENNLVNISESLEVLRQDRDEGRRSCIVMSPFNNTGEKICDVTDPFNHSKNVPDESLIVRDLQDETFDFDLPVTPVSSSERSVNTDDDVDDEIFFGPVGFKERCVATAVSSLTKEVKPLSPLNPRQFAEICKEANAVAARISAAGPKTGKTNAKEQILCSKQLNLNKTPCIFNPKAVGKLLKAVSSRTDNTENKENEMDVVSANTGSDKEVCDKAGGQNGTVNSQNDKANAADIDDNRTGRLPSLEVPLLDISGIAEIANEEKSGSSSSEEEKSKGKHNNGPHSNTNQESEVLTPSRRHNRSGTYTVSKVPHEKLPVDKRKSLPVVSHQRSAKKETDTSNSLKVKPASAGKRSSDVPHKEEPEKKSASKLKRSNSKLVRPTKVTIPTVESTSVPVLKKPSPEENTAQTKPKSRLSAPRAGAFGKDNSVLPSKLKAPGATAQPTGIPITTGIQPPQKSAIPGLKGKPVANGNGVKPAPMSKLQLMKPGAIQKSSLATSQNKPSSGLKKPGPMKAFVPAASSTENAPEMSTPAKEEKQIQPKNLMSSKFGTPQRTGSTSSNDSPASVNKRRSFLPTPNKSRTGSAGSMASPCPSKNSSIFSNSSRGSSLTDSPSLNESISKPRQRRPSGTKSTGKYSFLDGVNDQSPSAMRPKRQLVTNTPNLPRKKISPWSPVNKKQLDPEEQAIMCTKKMKR